MGATVGFVVIRLSEELIGGALLRFFAMAFTRIVPQPLLARAAERRLHPASVVLIFVALFGILLLIFGDLVGVIGGLLVIAALLGIPILLNKVEQWVWRAILRHRAKGAVEESSRREDSPPNLDQT